MNLEAGKTYLNRLGGRVRVEADPTSHDPYFFIGSDGYYRMADGGIYRLGSECDHDLIAEAPVAIESLKRALMAGGLGVLSVPPAKRKIVQIAASKRDIAALCDDGTLWAYMDGEWEQAPEIPQP